MTRTPSVYVTETSVLADFKFMPKADVAVTLFDFERYIVRLDSNAHASLMAGAV